MRLPRSNPQLIASRAFVDGDVKEPVVIKTRPGVQTVVLVTISSDDSEDLAYILPLPAPWWNQVDQKLDQILTNGQPVWSGAAFQFSIDYDPASPVWRIYYGTDAAPSGTARLHVQAWDEPLPPFVADRRRP